MSRFDSEQCEHARVWAALAPDGELSELERRSLRRKLQDERLKDMASLDDLAAMSI